jgi:hypothetical protein
MGDQIQVGLNGWGPSTETLLSGLRELYKAAEFAQWNKQDLWQFAVEIKALLRCGLFESDLRFLICQGLIEHAVESKHPVKGRRVFESADALILKKRSCFVLAEKGARFTWNHLNCSNENAPYDSDCCLVLPKWQNKTQILSVDGRVVKRFRWPAANQETVLAAFEEDNWQRIDDPLPPSQDVDSMSRLRDTIKSLNRNQQHRFIRFRGDGSGQGVYWEYTEECLAMLQGQLSLPADTTDQDLRLKSLFAEERENGKYRAE